MKNRAFTRYLHYNDAHALGLRTYEFTIFHLNGRLGMSPTRTVEIGRGHASNICVQIIATEHNISFGGGCV